MTPEGAFVEPRKPTIGQIVLRVALFGIALCVGAALVWTALLLLPFVLLAAFAGWWLLLRGERQPAWRRF